jgi:hypothetical protein
MVLVKIELKKLGIIAEGCPCLDMVIALRQVQQRHLVRHCPAQVE